MEQPNPNTQENEDQPEQSHHEHEEQPVQPQAVIQEHPNQQLNEYADQPNAPPQNIDEEPNPQPHEYEEQTNAQPHEHEEHTNQQPNECEEQDTAPPQEIDEEPYTEPQEHEEQLNVLPQENEDQLEQSQHEQEEQPVQPQAVNQEHPNQQLNEYADQPNAPPQEIEEEPEQSHEKHTHAQPLEDVEQPNPNTQENEDQLEQSQHEQEEQPVQPQAVNQDYENPQPPENDKNTGLEGIKKRKELLERIIDTAPSIIIGIDFEGKITIFNDVAEMITGFGKEEAMNNDFLSLLIPKEQWEETKAIFTKSRQGIPLYNIEKAITTKNGEDRQILWSSAPIEDEEGGLIGEIFIGNDITEKSIMVNEVIRQNKELTAINSVGLSLSHTNDLNATLKNALRRILEIISPAGGAIYILDERGENLVLKACHDIKPETSEIYGSFKRGEGVLSKVLGAKHHVLLKNLQLFSERSQKILKNEGFESIVFLPLRAKRGVIGVLAMGARDPKKLTQENLKVFTTISNQIGIIVDNFRLFNELSFVSKEWQNTMNTISDPMALISTKNKVLWVNTAYAHMMGALPKDLIGKGCCDIFHDQKSPVHSCLHKKVFETKMGFTEEVYDPDSGMTSQVTCSPYTNAKREIIGTMVITKDVTEKKEAENEIRYLKEFNENIVESLGDGVEIIGPDHKIQFMSKNFHKSVRKDVVGKTCYEVHFESKTPCEGCPITGNIENMSTQTIECLTPNGKNILVTHSPLKNQDGTYSAILLFKPHTEDGPSENESTLVPENTKPQERPEGPQIPQTENIPNISSVVAGIQHELKNPLGGILGNAEALGDEDDPIKMRILAKEISNAAERVDKLVDTLSYKTKNASSEVMEKIDLNEVIINSLNAMNQDEKFANVEVETDLKPVPKIKGDPVDILNVFINLITNSLETMQGHGKILISTRTQNGNVEIVFSDTGAGITKEQQKRLLSPTFGLEENFEEDSIIDNKMGLRMFTVSTILKKYNAPINIDSKEGKGTSFIVSFPYKASSKQNT